MTDEFHDLRVEVTGGSLTVRRRPGLGPTLLLLHYWGGSGRTWDPMLAHLDRQIPVASYDHRGWGRSKALPGPFDLARLAADAVAVIEALDTDIVLVGHSLGGKVAQLVAAEHPSALTGLVLVAPAPPEPPAAITPNFQQQLAHAYDTAQSVSDAIDHVLTSIPLVAQLRAAVVEDSLAGAVQARIEWPLHGIATNITSAARSISVPTTVVAGSRDVVEPVEVLRQHLVPFISAADVHVLDGPGHLIPLEAPAELAEQITLHGFKETRIQRKTAT